MVHMKNNILQCLIITEMVNYTPWNKTHLEATWFTPSKIKANVNLSNFNKETSIVERCLPSSQNFVSLYNLNMCLIKPME